MSVKPPNEPKRWRLRGKAADGLVVTLGRYDTEEEAQADCRKFAGTGIYRELAVQPIAVRAPVADAAPGDQAEPKRHG